MTDYECPICKYEFRYPSYEEGKCPKCGLRFQLEDDVEGRCLPVWENDPRYANEKSGLLK
jgi:rubredoxin